MPAIANHDHHTKGNKCVCGKGGVCAAVTMEIRQERAGERRVMSTKEKKIRKAVFFINQGQKMPRFDAASRHGLTHLSAKFEVKKLIPEQFLSQNWKVLKKHKVKKL